MNRVGVLEQLADGEWKEGRRIRGGFAKYVRLHRMENDGLIESRERIACHGEASVDGTREYRITAAGGQLLSPQAKVSR